MKSFVPSPLFIWKLIGISLVAILVVLSQTDPVKFHIKQRRNELPKKLEKTRRAQKQTDVVFFGNSLMQAALPQTEFEINETLSKTASKPVKASNLAQDGRTPWDIERRADLILGLKPKIIVVQTEMIVGRRRQDRKKTTVFEKQKQRFKDWISYAKAPLMEPLISGSTKKKQELLDALSSPAQIDIKILKESPEQEAQALEQIHLQRVREHWGGQTISLKSAEYRASSSFIDKATTNGARIVVVEAPISETAARVATEDYFEQRKNTVLAILGNDQHLYLSYPRVLPDKYFQDYSHVNQKGRKVFFKWLAPILAELLAERK